MFFRPAAARVSPPSRPPRRVTGGLALLAVLALTAHAQPPVVELSAGIHAIHAELAADDASRTRGLMFRDSIEPNHGMLFVFDSDERHCMWMHNTPQALSVAFLDGDGAIANIEEMQAQTDTKHCAARPVHLALEMPARWFAERGLKPGSMVQGVQRALHAR